MINVRVSTNKAFNAWTQDLFIPYVKLVRGGKKNVKRWKSGGETGVEFFGSSFQIDVKQVSKLADAFYKEYVKELTRQMNRNRRTADVSQGTLNYNKVGAVKGAMFNAYIRSLKHTTKVTKSEAYIGVGLNRNATAKEVWYEDFIDESKNRVLKFTVLPKKTKDGKTSKYGGPFPIFSREDNKVKWYTAKAGKIIILNKHKPINTEKAAAVAWAKVKAQGL